MYLTATLKRHKKWIDVSICPQSVELKDFKIFCPENHKVNRLFRCEYEEVYFKSVNRINYIMFL